MLNHPGRHDIKHNVKFLLDSIHMSDQTLWFHLQAIYPENHNKQHHINIPTNNFQ